jgi:meso-butanediol dehydrogenase/(S,S)-butanediol dehydrogenase/diacetyl reductase
MSNARFAGKTALITGAASGIGKASAQRLGSEGATLLISDINETLLASTATELQAQGIKLVTRKLDVSDPQQCRECVQYAVDSLGQLDILCNIAGFARAKHMTDITDDEWRKMIDVNLSSVFYMSRAAMPHLIQAKGCIVNMASSAGLEGQVYNAMYCASKAGVVMLSKSMAIEFAKQGVRVNAVCPGAVATPLMDSFVIPEGADMDLMAKLFPLMPAAQAEEIAGAVAYLASPEARYITGEALAIDGGQTAG